MLRGAMPTPPVALAGLLAALRRELRPGEPGSLRAHLIRGAGGVLTLRLANMFLGLVTGVVLARSLGASHYGIYAYSLAWLWLLKVPTELGLPTLITRNVAIYCVNEDWGRMRGLLVRANQAVLGMSLFVVLLSGGASWLLADWLEHAHALPTFWLALLLLPLFGLTALRYTCLRGLHRVLLAEIPDALARPGLFLTLLGVVWLFGRNPLTPELAMGLQLVAVGCAFILGVFFVLRSLPCEIRRTAPHYEMRAWVSSALPFLLTGGLTFINTQTDIIMLGWFGVAADVGVYRVVGLGAGLVGFGFAAAHHVLGPIIARLHTEGDTVHLQRVITQAARAILLFSLPATLFLIVFGGAILARIFGPEYALGATALAILAVGQLVSAGSGLAALLLDMTGHERDTAKNIALSALLNVALNAFFIPLWGIEGAALASVASLATSNLLLVVLAYRRLGLYSLAFWPRRASGSLSANPDVP
jgi:O-antigen/teichoic acid export membrane protein